MTRPIAEDPEDPGEVFGYGLKWVPGEGGHRLLGHSGGMIGYTAYLLVDPDAGFGVDDPAPTHPGATGSSSRGSRSGAWRPRPEVSHSRRSPSRPIASACRTPRRTPARFATTTARSRSSPRATACSLGRGRWRAPLLPVSRDRFAVDAPHGRPVPARPVRRDGALAEASWDPGGSRRTVGRRKRRRRGIGSPATTAAGTRGHPASTSSSAAAGSPSSCSDPRTSEPRSR